VKHENFLKYQLEKLTTVGIALSAIRSLPTLLEMILDEGRELTNADGGTLYLVEGGEQLESRSLRYHIMQTASLNFRAGGNSPTKVTFPNLPLYLQDGTPNYNNISAYSANTGKTVNIPDWRTFEGFDFTGPRKHEEITGYVSKSFLVVAMRDHEDQIIGVLQLLNALDPTTGEKVTFNEQNVEIIEAFASQAAMAITNVRLIQDTENLFNSFAEVMASAIDERSPATAGHIKKVTQITLALAEAVNKEKEGPFADVKFSPDDLNELRLAALLHDVGKVTTPLHVVEKAGKLQTIYDRIGEVQMRFELIKRQIEVDYSRQMLEMAQSGSPRSDIDAVRAEMVAKMQEVDEELIAVDDANTPVEWMPPEKAERIKVIGAKTYWLNGVERPYLEPDELANLVVQRGNITGGQLQEMRHHAAVSIRLLTQIPFTRKLRNIPKIAGAHHEFINGKGYPLGLAGEEITIQTRMMTIADIYEAVTAADRSYKKGKSQEEAIEILKKAAKFGEIDPELLDLFIRSEVWRLVGKSAAEMNGSVTQTNVVAQAAAGKQPETK